MMILTAIRDWWGTVLVPGVLLLMLKPLERDIKAQQEALRRRRDVPLWSETGEYWEDESCDDPSKKRPAAWVWRDGMWSEVVSTPTN